MNICSLDPKTLSFKANASLETGLALITAGTPSDFNTMTIGWGMFGRVWSQPAYTAYVKHSRYTHRYLHQNETFSICYFTPEHKRDLAYLGTKSGRDEDKLSHTKLSVEFIDGIPVFPQAYLTLLCTKVASHDLTLDTVYRQDILDRYYKDNYTNCHTAFIGVVDDVFAHSDFVQKFPNGYTIKNPLV